MAALPPQANFFSLLRTYDTRSVFWGCLGVAGFLFSSVLLSSVPPYRSYICDPKTHKTNAEECQVALLYSLAGHVAFIVLTWLAKYLGHVYRDDIIWTAVVRTIYTWGVALMSAYAGSFFTGYKHEPLKWIIPFSFTHFFWLMFWDFDDDLGLEDAITAAGLSIVVRIPEHTFYLSGPMSLLGILRHWIPVIRLWAARRPWIPWILALVQRTLNLQPRQFAPPRQPAPQLNVFIMMFMFMLRQQRDAQPRLLPAPRQAHPTAITPELSAFIQTILPLLIPVFNARAQEILQLMPNVEEPLAAAATQNIEETDQSSTRARQSSSELILDIVESESSSVFLTPRQSVEEECVALGIPDDETATEGPTRLACST